MHLKVIPTHIKTSKFHIEKKRSYTLIFGSRMSYLMQLRGGGVYRPHFSPTLGVTEMFCFTFGWLHCCPFLYNALYVNVLFILSRLTIVLRGIKKARVSGAQVLRRVLCL